MLQDSWAAIKHEFAAGSATTADTPPLSTANAGTAVPRGFIADAESLVNGAGQWMQGVFVRDGRLDTTLRGRCGGFVLRSMCLQLQGQTQVSFRVVYACLMGDTCSTCH